LFFENRVKLPFLNVDLPLRGFFALGTPIFVVLHPLAQPTILVSGGSPVAAMGAVFVAKTRMLDVSPRIDRRSSGANRRHYVALNSLQPRQYM
jgi:hypothetical protein